MIITYVIEAIGLENVPHPEDFAKKWLGDGNEGLLEKARKLIAEEIPSNKYSSQPAHGMFPGNMIGWTHVGCLGTWMRGNVCSANCHCLEVFMDPLGDYYLVDQSEHGRASSGYRYDAQILSKIDLVKGEPVKIGSAVTFTKSVS